MEKDKIIRRLQKRPIFQGRKRPVLARFAGRKCTAIGKVKSIINGRYCLSLVTIKPNLVDSFEIDHANIVLPKGFRAVVGDRIYFKSVCQKYRRDDGSFSYGFNTLNDICIFEC